MSIYETIVCDYCEDVHNGTYAPDNWVTWNGKHYCTRFCATTDWEYYTEDGVLDVEGL